MAKKTVKPKVVWAVLKDKEIYTCYVTFADAAKEAESVKQDDEGSEVQIIEIHGAWELMWPEEPDPEVIEIGLEDL